MSTALFSVYDKTGMIPLARKIHEKGWRILASGGTAGALRDAGIPVRDVGDYTGAPEMLGGRVKTLHPAIHGGILARSSEADMKELESRGYGPIDMVVVNLYPFEKTVADPDCGEAEAIEQIDIGGVALIRAAAKNHERVTLLCDPEDYGLAISEIESGGIRARTRRKLAVKGFLRSSEYDAAIHAWLAARVPEGGQPAMAEGCAAPKAAAEIQAASGLQATAGLQTPAELRGSAETGAPSPLTLSGHLVRALRYGENPHQTAELYSFEPGAGPLGGRVLQGKELSYNNILDLDAAWQAVRRFERPACVVVKHLSPCGIAEADSVAEAMALALDCDRISAFGGIIAVNRPFEGACARGLGQLFAECVAAPEFDGEALGILARKKNLRLVIPGGQLPRNEIRSVLGGFLRQDIDFGDPAGTEWKVVSRRAPTAEETETLRFAWKACMSVKSNAIVLAKGSATVGIGGGQPNRVDSTRIAVNRAGEKSRGSVLASDAFFPFPDSVEEAARAGITAIVHPGGSLRDQESVDAADRAGIAMICTGIRHFRH